MSKKETWTPFRLYIHKTVLESPEMTKKIPETNFVFIDCMLPPEFAQQPNPVIILGTGETREFEYDIVNEFIEDVESIEDELSEDINES